MTRTAANSLILTDGYIYTAPVGTTAPTDTTAALNAAFLDCGWVDENGITVTPQGSTTELKGITGATLAFIKDGDGFEYTCTLTESSATTASLLAPNSTAVTAAGITTRTVKSVSAPPSKAWVIEEHYSNGKIRRIVVPMGSAVIGAVTSKHNGFRSFPLTISAIQASDGVLHVDITDNPAESVT